MAVKEAEYENVDEGAPPRDINVPVSELPTDDLYRTLRSWYREDDAHSQEWRDQARKDFDFVAGDQWEEKTKANLESESRAPLSFNYTLAFIKAVAGLEINSRHEIVFLPRGLEPGEIIANETISGTSKWMGDNCDAEDHQSEAFQDTVICGMGWTDSRMDYEEEADGKYLEPKLDPIEMRWDRSAREKNLQDARRVHRARKMLLDEARALFPEADTWELNASWATSGEDENYKDPQPVEERRLKQTNSVPADPRGEVTIVHTQWWERQMYYRVIDPGTGEEHALSPDQFKALQKKLKRRVNAPAIQSMKAYRKVYKQAFLGATVLHVGDCPCDSRFTFQCITGQLHKNKGHWFGLVKLMRDPQMNANKWLSQALHILNTTAKGGILAERTAFKDIREAQRTYAKADAITIVEDQAIQKGKIMQKPGVGLAAPFIEMMRFAIQAIPDVTGINLELLGMRDANQPGILEAQRKQSAMTLLATLMDALRRYRKNVGRVRLFFIQNYLPDGMIIRVNGPTGYQGVKFIRDEHLGDYDVEVSDAPTSPNQKEATWAMLMQMAQLPAFQAILTPEMVAEFLNYCPLPTQVVAMMRKMMGAPNPQKQIAQQLQIKGATAQIAKTEADTEKAHSGSQLDNARALLAMADAAVKQNQAHASAAVTSLMRTAPGPKFGALIPPMQMGGSEQYAIAPMAMDMPQRQLPEPSVEGMAPQGSQPTAPVMNGTGNPLANVAE